MYFVIIIQIKSIEETNRKFLRAVESQYTHVLFEGFKGYEISIIRHLHEPRSDLDYLFLSSSISLEAKFMGRDVFLLMT